MRTLFIAFGLSLSLAGAAAAQSSSSITTHQTPVGPITHAQTVSQQGNGTQTRNTISPGNNTQVAPAVTITNTNPEPNRSQGTTTATVGVAIPLK